MNLNYVNLFRKPSTNQGTMGEMIAMGKSFCTLELPYRDINFDGKSDNEFSRIEPGITDWDWVMSPKRGRNIYQARNTGHRLAVQLHSGNFAGDVKLGFDSHVEGCILIGKRFGELPNKKGDMQLAVLDSRAALAEFEELMKHQSFKLNIQDVV